MINAKKQSAMKLADHIFPIGSNEVRIIITGHKIVPEDYDALISFVVLFKSQLERKVKLECDEIPAEPISVLPKVST